MDGPAPLRDFVERPFELLLEMERRALARFASSAEAGEEWVGVGLRVGDDQYVVPREQVREVMKRPPLTRVPGADPWMLGLANVRGQLVPIVDLKLMCQLPATPNDRRARVVLVNSDEVPMGVVVDEVFGFRRFAPDDRVATTRGGEAREGVRVFTDGEFRREGASWPVLSFFNVIRSRQLLSAS